MSINELSNKYGKLTITKIVGKNKVLAVCDCGSEKEYWLNNVRSGKTVSCGCLNRQKASERYSKLTLSHGLSGHPLYRVYGSMIKRCYNEKDISFKRYGARGVTVCDEWKTNFISFYNWGIENGWKEGLQIDKDIKGNGKNIYSPETCQFVTRKINCRNRKTNKFIEYNGETKTLAEWCEVFNIKSHTTILNRIHRGWSIEKSLLTKTKYNNNVKS